MPASTPLHYLLALESTLNILSAVPMLITPRLVLSYILVPHPHPINPDPALSHPATFGFDNKSGIGLDGAGGTALAALVQYIGALLVAMTVPMIYGIPDAKAPSTSSSTTSSNPPSASSNNTTTAKPSPSPPTSSLHLTALKQTALYRRRIYVSLAVGELLLLPALIAQILSPDMHVKGGTPGALKPGFLLCAIVVLADVVALRGFVLVCREGWFGWEGGWNASAASEAQRRKKVA